MKRRPIRLARAIAVIVMPAEFGPGDGQVVLGDNRSLTLKRQSLQHENSHAGARPAPANRGQVR
jgi:hypothetical protein